MDKTIRGVNDVITPGSTVLVLTGAGCSTASGLGDYRNKQGLWKRAQPITGETFRTDLGARARYWARSSVGWPQFSKAEPNQAHHALATLEASGTVQNLVTQNVDELHQRAGHRSVIDLHGKLSTLSCVACNTQQSRDRFQQQLLDRNPWLATLNASYAPDGDADLNTDASVLHLIDHMHIPGCNKCGALMKPDVVFFGENVPKDRVALAMQQLREVDVLLVAGSSLMVLSGFRFCRDAHQRKQPIVILNQGVTRADDIATLRVSGDCGKLLTDLAATTGQVGS